MYLSTTKQKKHLLVISQVGLSQNGVPLNLLSGSFGATPHSKTHRKIVSNIKSQYEPDVNINIPLSSH